MDPNLTAPEIKSFEDVRSAFLGVSREVKAFIEKATGEIAAARSVSAETKSAIEKKAGELESLGQRLDKMEAKHGRDPIGSAVRKTLGAMFIESDDYKAISTGRQGRARLEVKAITNTLPLTNDQPLVQADRVREIIANPDRRLRIRDVIPSTSTSSNLIEYTKELVFTNSAGPQVGGSPTIQAENVAKPESDITFSLTNTPVITLAHYILASKQVLADAPMLQGYIENRLIYGLKLEEEDQLLNGDGGAGNLSGLRQNQTAYSRHVSGDKRIDTIRRAATQLSLSEYDAEIVVLNPANWEQIELSKDTQGRYLIGNPQGAIQPRLWNLPVLATNSMPVDNFLVANVTMAAQIFDREQAGVELSREDGDNFKKNMVTLLAEERIALAVYRAQALIGGQFPQTGNDAA